jgi:Polyketide cyclase / dehydrase and lipid transport
MKVVHMTRTLKVAATGACLWFAGMPARLARADDANVEPPPATSAPSSKENAPKVTSSDADGVFTTNGTASIAAPRKTVFAVLLDYGHMASFIKSLQSSSVSAHRGNQLTVVQQATGKAGPFSKDVHTVLAVTSKSPSKITFVDTEKKDFYRYEGSWALSGSGKTTTASYQLIAKLKGMAPEGITKGAFKANVEKMMVEVRTEAEKRAAR